MTGGRSAKPPSADPASVDRRSLNRATLSRQWLTARVEARVTEAVHHLGALQAQHPPSPYLALWNRVAALDPSEVDDAFTTGALVKGSMMRTTLHTVAGEEYGDYRGAMMASLRAAGLKDRRFTETGLSPEQADDLADQLTPFMATPRTRVEIETELTRLLGHQSPPGLWRALRLCAPWRHGPDESPWSFGRPARFLADSAVSDGHASLDTDGLVARLIERYLTAYGPASTRDIAQFTILRAGPIKAGIARLGDRVVTLSGPDGELVDLVDGPRPSGDSPAPPRLLSMWDNLLLAYADRSRIIPDQFRPLVIRRNGDVLATVLVDGYVAGVWRSTEAGIEVTPFDHWPAEVWSQIETEATALARFLDGRDRFPNQSYDRWFRDLPTDLTRTITWGT